MLKNANGQLVTDSEKIKERWKKYTARKICQQPRFLQRYCIPYLQEPLVIEDKVTSTLRSLPSQNATGTDGLPQKYGKQHRKNHF